MFEISTLRNGDAPLEYRRERLTGLSCTISPGRLERNLAPPPAPIAPPGDCPFCPGRLERETPTFPGGRRIHRGESVTFPNLYPYAATHTVGVITRAHACERFEPRQLADAFTGVAESLLGADGHASINWNYLHSAGASIDHPHLQGLVDPHPSHLHALYLQGSERYLERTGRTYWEALREHERFTGRYLFGDEVMLLASAVPLGEREVRALLPVATLEEAIPYFGTLAEGLVRVIDDYRALGWRAFNLSCFFGRPGRDRGFFAFCSVISRINPNTASISDSAFMERLHQHPVVMTRPEDLAAGYRAGSGMTRAGAAR
ncbi:MAG: galactose-1-phosphate uridylyltransferase [Methanospirillum sp.]|nr:galactose-1-phosphate uridylyltransferase [Methanospirillum sp.]